MRGSGLLRRQGSGVQGRGGCQESVGAGKHAAQVTIVVVVSRQTFSRILEVLKFDWRQKDGMHGRILGRQLQVMDLKRGVSTTLLANDRLEAAGDIRDIHCDNCSLLPDPCTIVFFQKEGWCFLEVHSAVVVGSVF